MPIIKNECDKAFTLIPNELAQLAQTGVISYEAAGVLVDMCSRPDDWIVHKEFYHSNAGRDVVHRIFKELQCAGYLKVDIVRDEQGKIVDKMWFVSNKPIYKPYDTTSHPTEKPSYGKTIVRKNHRTEKQHLQIKRYINKENNTNKENIYCAISVTGYSEKFEEAWANYPARLGPNSKRAAWKFWSARVRENWSEEDLLLATINFAVEQEAIGNANTAYIIQAQRFYGKSLEFEKYIQYDFENEGLKNAVAKRNAIEEARTRRETIRQHEDEIRRSVERRGGIGAIISD